MCISLTAPRDPSGWRMAALHDGARLAPMSARAAYVVVGVYEGRCFPAFVFCISSSKDSWELHILGSDQSTALISNFASALSPPSRIFQI